MSTLTRAFTRARYGLVAPTAPEAALIREAWERLRFAGEMEADDGSVAAEDSEAG